MQREWRGGCLDAMRLSVAKATSQWRRKNGATLLDQEDGIWTLKDGAGRKFLFDTSAGPFSKGDHRPNVGDGFVLCLLLAPSCQTEESASKRPRRAGVPAL